MIGLPLLLYLLLLIPGIQQKITDLALDEVMKITKTKMTIGKLYFKPFSHLDAQDIYVEDLQGDTLLYAHNLSAGVSLFKLINNRLQINSVQLENFKIYVNRDSLNSDFNFQFLIDAFASEDTTWKDKSSMIIEIDKVRLTGGTLHYDILSENSIDSVFDSNHIHIHDFNADLTLKSIDPEKLDVGIKSLSFIEKNNFQLKDISAKINSEKKVINIKDLKLALPHSNLTISKASADYTGHEIAHLADSAAIDLTLESSIHLYDLQAFYPAFSSFKDELKLSGAISGKLPQIDLKELNLTYGNLLILKAKAFIADYVHWPRSGLQVNIDQLNASPELFDLFGNDLKEVNYYANRIGRLSASASVSGSLPDMQLKADLLSPSGNLNITGKGGYFYPSGKTNFDINLSAINFNLQTITGTQSTLGETSLKMTALGSISENGKISAHTEAFIEHIIFNQYNYQNIELKGDYVNDSIIASVSINDPNAKFLLDGKYFMPTGKNIQGIFTLHAGHVNLDKLNLLKIYPGANFSGDVNGSISGNNLDNLQGNLDLSNLIFKTNKGTFSQKQILLSLNRDTNNEQIIDIKSDVLSGNIKGIFSFETLPVAINNTFNKYLPAFFNFTKTKQKDTRISSFFVIGNTESLSQTLELPLTIMAPADLSWNYHDTENVFDIKGSFPQIKVGTMPLNATTFDIQTEKDKNTLVCSAKTQRLIEQEITDLGLNIAVANDSMNVTLSAKDNALELDGNLVLVANFVKNNLSEKSSLPDIYAQLKPSKINLQKHIFDIKPAYFSIIEDKYTVKDLELTTPKQGSLKVNGIVSLNENDTLTASFDKILIGEVLDLIKYQGVRFNGEINGSLIMNRLLTNPRILTRNFSIKDIFIEEERVGDLDVASGWSDRRQAGFINLTLHQQDAPDSKISGFILTNKDSLSLNADVRALKLGWIQPFVKDYLFGMRGDFEARLSVTGKFEKPQLDGLLFIRNAGLGVRMTNVRYKVNDSIRITPNTIKFDRFRILDNMNNPLIINGNITHQNFNTFNVGLSMQLRNLLLLNNPIQTDSLFYGTLKSSGAINLKGTEKGMTADINIPKGISGKVYVQLPESEVQAQQYSYVVYVNTDSVDSFSTEGNLSIKKPASSFPIKIKLNADIGPELTLGAIINPSTKDAATVNGSGNITMNYDLSSSEMKLLGDYTMEEGKIALSLKNIAKREFTIKNGSKVTFQGDPMATAFNVTAMYSLRADLATLDESFATNQYLPATRVPVNCILNVSGDIKKMKINYDVELPTVDESVQRTAESIMNSDEIKIKEVAYLLAMGTFYMPQPSDQSQKISIWTSLASSTLSTQLNNLLAGVLHDNWTIGTNFYSRDDNFSNVEMDVSVSSRFFNNRLTINTNLGYRSDVPSNAKTNFTGDFEALYKLNKTGEYSLKFYTVTNDKYYEQALTTQGLGFVYKKSAKTFRELFQRAFRRKRIDNSRLIIDNEKTKNDSIKNEKIKINTDSIN